MRRLRLSAAVLVAASLVLAGCGGDDEPSDGLPAGPGDRGRLDPRLDLAADRPPGGGRRQRGAEPPGDGHQDRQHRRPAPRRSGSAAADMVVEELVEGGLTRLAVFYYSELPEKVGPVRSMRASDIGIVSPVDGCVVTSGAAGKTIARIKGAGITFFQEGAKGIYRDTGRSAPYNVFANLDRDRRRHRPGRAPPRRLPAVGRGRRPAQGPEGQRRIAASFGGHATNWQFKNGTYDNLNTYAADGDEFTADTVLVLRVQVGDAGYPTPPATRSPRPSSRARARRCSSTTAAWCAPPGARTASRDSSPSPPRPAS